MKLSLLISLRVRVALILSLCWTLVPLCLANSLSIEETRGKQLYFTGTSASGAEIQAIFGQQSIEVPASTLPCTSCHGEDGQGKPEGGILPTNITWRFLAKSYGHQHLNSRKHQAFTEASFSTAITEGFDPAGNPLDIAMPRYRLSTRDISDLISYLKRLSTDYDPGLSNTTIRVGSLLPLNGPLGDTGIAMKEVITAYFNEINERGGIYKRKIIFDVIEYSDNHDATRKNLRRLIENESVFAMLANISGDMEKEILAITESSGILQIGPYSLFPEDHFSSNRSTFYLFPGLKQQSRALVDYIVDVLGLENPQVSLIGPSGIVFQEAAEGVETQGQKHDWSKITRFSYTRGEFDAQSLAMQFKKNSPDVLFYFGDNQTLPALLAETDQTSSLPYVFLSGSLTNQSVFKAPKTFHNRIFLAYPTLARDQTNREELAMLLKKQGLSTRHLAAKIAAYSSARLLVEALQRTGSDLSRKKIIQTIEKLYQFDNGLIPPLTYGPNRHIGSTGIYIVNIDLEKKRFVDKSHWIEAQ